MTKKIIVSTAGLKPTHHEDLNTPSDTYPGGKEARDRRIATLRAEYAGDKVAQQQINVYANDTQFHNKFRELLTALATSNSAKEAELDAWFEKHYPDVVKNRARET